MLVVHATGRQSPNHYVQPTHSFRGGPGLVSASLFDHGVGLRREIPVRGRENAQREEREEEANGYTPTASTVEVVQALLVACSRTYTLDHTFDLGSRSSAKYFGLLSSPVERIENSCKGNFRNETSLRFIVVN